MIKTLVLIVIAFLIYWSCAILSDNQEEVFIHTNYDHPIISVRAAPETKFYAASIMNSGYPAVIIYTIHQNKSGESYAAILFNCAGNTSKYLFTTKDKEEFQKLATDWPDDLGIEDMEEIIVGSIEYFVGKYACSREKN